MSTVEYVKCNTYRKDKFNLRTIIESTEGEKRVRKVSTCSESNLFIKRIFRNYELLQSNYHTLNICNAYQNTKLNNEITFDFIEGPTLTDMLVNFINENNKKSFIDLLIKFKSLVLDNYKINILKAFNVTENFIEIFGNYTGEFPFEYISIANIDMYFDNIILNNNVYHIIDYEWVFDFPIPVKYLLYRNAVCLYYKIGMLLDIKNFSSLKEIFNLYDIYEDDIYTFSKMEENFSKYVSEENFNNYNNFLKNNYCLDEIKNENDKYKIEISEIENENNEYKIEVSELKNKILNLNNLYKARISSIEEQITTLIQSRNNYMSSYNEILNSTSWKATKPFRFSTDKIRKLINDFKLL